MDDPDRLSALRADLVKRLGPKRYDMWVGTQTILELSPDELSVACASIFELQWLRQRIHTLLAESCREICGEKTSIRYFVKEQEPATSKMVQKTLLNEEKAATVHCGDSVAPCKTDTGRHQAKPDHAVLARSTFANFVVGKCNELAYRMAKSVAENAGYYGPLLLHGSSGTGKTHLLYAMAHDLKCRAASRRVLRLTAEQFTTEFLDALNRRALAGFRQKHRSVDVLLIDDIQFLLNKRATFEELLITIDSLHERGKQVVLTSGCTPQELLKVSSELATRISGGLTVPLELPDFATRQALVRRFIAEMHPAIGMAIDDGIVTAIATQVAGSARELRGAINRLVVTSQALRKPLTPDLARTALAEYVQLISPPVRLPDIQRALCEVFGLEASNLKSTSKVRSLAVPRMLGMWLACSLTRSALGEISEFFGRRSHSTVISAQKKIEKMVSRGEKISVANGDCSIEEVIGKVQQALRRA